MAQGVWPNLSILAHILKYLGQQTRLNRCYGEDYRPLSLNNKTTRDFLHKKENNHFRFGMETSITCITRARVLLPNANRGNTCESTLVTSRR